MKPVYILSEENHKSDANIIHPFCAVQIIFAFEGYHTEIKRSAVTETKIQDVEWIMK